MTSSLTSSDGELVARSLRGESDAFADLYNRYFPSVYDFLHRTMRNADEAADVTQETFLQAMQKLGSLANPASFKSWLFTIAHHQALNRLERQKRFVEPYVSSGDEEEADPFFSQVDTDRLANPEQAAEMKETARLVWESAATLDKRTYAVLDLHVRQGLESAEIAEVLGVSKGNAYTMLNRMKRSLEEAISVYLLVRRGSKYCDVLQSLIAPFEIPPVTTEMRKAVERHVRKCDVCTESKRTLMAPLAVFGAFACVPAPEGLREHVWGDLASQWSRIGPPSYQASLTAKPQLVGKRGGGKRGPGIRAGLGASVPSGRRLLLVLGAAIIVALVPVFLIMSSVSLPGGTTVSSATKTATATKRPPASRTATKVPTATVVKTATATETATPAPTSVQLPPTVTPPSVAATRTPAVTRSPALTPTPRPSATPFPTRTPIPTHTPRPSKTPYPGYTPPSIN